jgi:protein-S-isoprenylcysteine O-methyltransferase Ste14
MAFRAALDVLALLLASGYSTIPPFWLMTHPFVERWRRLGRRAYFIILPAWAVVIAGVFLIVLPFRFAHLYLNGFAWAPAALFFLLGFSIYTAAFRGFRGAQLSGLAELEPDRHPQQLVTTGIRARVRHPIYLGHLCELLGWSVGTGLIALYALVVFAILTGGVMIRMEDRELEARFGKAYQEYKSKVPAVIPFW